MPKSSRVALDIPAHVAWEGEGAGEKLLRAGSAVKPSGDAAGGRGQSLGAGGHCGCWAKLLTSGVGRGAGISQLELIFSSGKKTLRVDFFLQRCLDSISSKQSWFHSQAGIIPE